MKKDIILFGTIFLVLSMIAGGTYAYWQWVNERTTTVVFNTVSSDISKYVVYDAGESHFVGDFQPTTNYCGGMSNTISFYKKDNIANQSLTAAIKMNVNSIGENIKSSDNVYWVLTSGNSSSCTGNLSDALAYGTFKGVEANSTITLKSNIEITTSNKIFTIWIWVKSGASDSLSGETIDVNIWSQIDMMDSESNVAGIYGEAGSFMSWDELVANRMINVENNLLTGVDFNNFLASGVCDDVGDMTLHWLCSSEILEMIIPSSITSIGPYAFSSINGLNITGVMLPNSMTIIGDYAFSEAMYLRNVYIPNSVVSIGNEAFGYIAATSIIIPNSVTSIGTEVFSASYITDIYYTGTEDEWNAIEIGESNYELFNATIHYNYTG